MIWKILSTYYGTPAYTVLEQLWGLTALHQEVWFIMLEFGETKVIVYFSKLYKFGVMVEFCC